MTSKNARKRQRQRRQKARTKAKRQAARQAATPAARQSAAPARQSVAPVATRPAPRRDAVPVAATQRTTAADRPIAAPPLAPPPRRLAPPPMRVDPPHRPRGRQRVTLGVAAALISAGALVGAALLFVHPGSGDGRAERTAAATRYRPPRPVPPNTSYVETRVTGSGDLRVTHWINSRTPVSALRLVPPDVGGLPSLKVRQVVVVGDRTHAVTSDGGPREYYLSAAHHLYVRYILSGAVTRAPRPAGRGLAVITNLEVGGLSGLTETTHSVVGARVLNLACSAPTPEAVPSPCGESGSDGWRAALQGASADDRVMAQLDLGDSAQQ